jgi:ABC-type nitrate/sulfonate/bicarbonate transport system substrate-binding protein
MTRTRQVSAITAGFIPLIDSAVLLAAAKQGFAAAENIELQLVRETSWANIRDKIAVGHLDVAHMLAPMPIANNLGLTPLPTQMIAPMALGTGGNAIALSSGLWADVVRHGATASGDPASLALALKAAIAERSGRLTFGIVHPHSSHHYELAYVLGFAGIRPDVDVQLSVVPPALMADALEAGQIDGFSVGEPWGTVAAMRGIGTIATTKSAIWRSSPEKVLGMRRDWAASNADTLARLIRALYRAATWCDAAENREELVRLLAAPEYLAIDVGVLLAAIEGHYAPVAKSADGHAPIFRFATAAASFPWQSHAAWYYSQMVRWGQTPFCEADAELAQRTFRPDIYRAALSQQGITIPSANAKIEGALAVPTPVGATRGQLVLGPDGFFDGRIFDPDKLVDYIAGFEVCAHLT